MRTHFHSEHTLSKYKSQAEKFTRCFSVVFNLHSHLHYTKSTDTLVNNVIPDNILTGEGIEVPKSLIKNLKRKDRNLRRETIDALEPTNDYDKMKAQKIQKNKFLRKLEAQRRS